MAIRKGRFSISILSPKIALFFIALFSQFVAVGDSLTAKLVIVLTPLVIDGLWYTIITFTIKPASVDKIRSKAQLIDRLSGIVLILLALRVVMTV